MSSVSEETGAPRGVAGLTGGARTAEWLVLGGLLLAGLLIRLLLIGAEGYKNDIASFESWSLTLTGNPLAHFYDKANFVDYPPGYLYVLFIGGWFHQHFLLPDPSYTHLKYVVKLPAIVMDLVDAALLFALVRQFATRAVAFAAAAFMALNPAAIVVSAYWGQVDSVPAGFALAAILLVVRSARGGDRGYELVFAWIALAISVLMKPAASVLIALLAVYPFLANDRATLVKRLQLTLAGAAGGLLVGGLGSVPFYPGHDPLATLRWLYERYAHGKDVYPYNSINAFNLYAVFKPFWQPDNQQMLFLPQFAWGLVLFLSAAGLVLWRLLQRRDNAAIVEAAFLLSFAYFLFPTRIHERYVFDAFVFAPALFFAGRRYAVGAVAITLTLLANLAYSLYYAGVMDAKVQGLNPFDLLPWLTHPAAALNVLVFFYLGYVFLGANVAPLEVPAAWAAPRARRWFAPREGVAAMRPLDIALAAGLALLFFAIAIVNLGLPKEKIFDEIYYARAAEEYLKHMDLFEWTHPPLTKLVITLSTALFGDTSFGWRMMNLVVGTLSVALVYAFAKRLLGSTLFAAVAAGLLVFDGFHFVQSRIATPEITVAFLSLGTLYAFYRYWLAAQVRAVPNAQASPARTVAGAAVAGVAAGLVASLAAPFAVNTATHLVTFLYVGIGAYLAVRLIVPYLLRLPGLTAWYADGTAVTSGERVVVRTFDGGRIEKGQALAGAAGVVEAKAILVRSADGLSAGYDPTGALRYATPEGTATFSPDAVMSVEAAATTARDAKLWLWILALCCGALAASKWNGLFDFFVVWLLAALVVSQRWWAPLGAVTGWRITRWPALWGNPFGFPLDVLVAAMLFTAASVYLLAYIPFFDPHLIDQSGKPVHKAFSDLLILQRSMYAYHHDLRATHPYASQWWQWPLLLRPISYYYSDFRPNHQGLCCVAEILALPNPLVWWLGLVSLPFLALRGWLDRNKGYLLLVVAYVLQWLPWVGSPRIAFEYHFFPNLAVIVLANAALLHWLWKRPEKVALVGSWRPVVIAYLACVVGAFAFWYPILSGTHITWPAWDARMLHWLVGNDWI